MNKTQYKQGIGFIDVFLKREWINAKDHSDLEYLLDCLLNNEKESGMKFLDSLETLPREKGYEILKTIGYIKKKIQAKVNSKTTGIPFLFRGQTVTILDCIEISEEEELYSYQVELDYHGQIYTTWINNEDLKF